MARVVVEVGKLGLGDLHYGRGNIVEGHPAAELAIASQGAGSQTNGGDLSLGQLIRRRRKDLSHGPGTVVIRQWLLPELRIPLVLDLAAVQRCAVHEPDHPDVLA